MLSDSIKRLNAIADHDAKIVDHSNLKINPKISLIHKFHDHLGG